MLVTVAVTVTVAVAVAVTVAVFVAVLVTVLVTVLGHASKAELGGLARPLPALAGPCHAYPTSG